MFEGSYVALVTPFTDGVLDEAALRELIDWHVAQGTAGLVPCGTTGESATLSHDEHNRVIELVIEAAADRVPVLAGTGSNCTDEAVRLTKHAEAVGADGALLICPYYNKPTQEGLYQHFRAVAEAVAIPLVLYNIASRTGINMTPETVIRLANTCQNIVGIKEASGDVDQMSQIINGCDSAFTLISGDDALTLPVMSVGGKGVISVVANVVPDQVSQMVEAAAANEWDTARDLHYRMLPLVHAMFLETNPVPVKTAMAMLGRIQPDVRLPLADMDAENRSRLRQVVEAYGLTIASPAGATRG